MHRKRGPTERPGPKRDEPVLIPMYAKTSWRPPPPRPFLNLLCFPVYCLRRLCERLLDCPLMLSAHFLTPTSSTVKPCHCHSGAPTDPSRLLPAVTVQRLLLLTVALSRHRHNMQAKSGPRRRVARVPQRGVSNGRSGGPCSLPRQRGRRHCDVSTLDHADSSSTPEMIRSMRSGPQGKVDGLTA